MTLQCIAGVQTPDSGRIVLDGETLFDSARSINLPPQKRRVGYLFQHYALFPHMTVEKNILCGLHGEKDKAVRRQRVREMVELLQLEGLEQHRPKRAFGRQAQRAALARMLVSQPRLLLLDEPFSALDSHLRDQLQPQFLHLLRTYVGRRFWSRTAETRPITCARACASWTRAVCCAPAAPTRDLVSRAANPPPG